MMMANWFKIAKDGILDKAQSHTAITAKRNLTAVMAVHDLDKSKKSMLETAPQSWCIKLENQNGQV